MQGWTVGIRSAEGVDADQEFRSAEEMNQLVWREPGSAELARALASVWAFGRRLRPARLTPGVRKFRSVEEMKAARQI